MRVSKERYDLFAVILHWVMAVSFILMLASGIAMTREDFLPQQLQFKMYQWHKSLGVLLLAAFFLRIGWRIFNKPPHLPDSMKGLEKFAAKAGHWVLYIMMLLLPLSGWAMVSSSPYGLPTLVFSWFEWPHIPGLAGDDQVNKLAKEGHEIMGYAFIALILGHILAVVKHAVIDKHNLLPRMWFGAVVAALILIPVPVQAETYTVDYEKSSIKFRGKHADTVFKGEFGEWEATINFDPDDLENSEVKVVVQTESAKTGELMYDSTLPSDDWFNVKDYPEAVYQSRTFVKEEDYYSVEGLLTIKGEGFPVTFLFTLTETGDISVAKAFFEIDRLMFDIGTRSDPEAKWVSQAIEVQFQVTASR